MAPSAGSRGNVERSAFGLLERRESAWISFPSSLSGSLRLKAPYAPSYTSLSAGFTDLVAS